MRDFLFGASLLYVLPIQAMMLTDSWPLATENIANAFYALVVGGVLFLIVSLLVAAVILVLLFALVCAHAMITQHLR